MCRCSNSRGRPHPGRQRHPARDRRADRGARLPDLGPHPVHLSLFAVGNSALINMMMASRLLYGMSKRGVLPSFLSKVHSKRQTPFAAILFTTAIALVNVSVLVLRRDTVDHEHFRTPTALPVLGVIVCVYLVLPWSSGRPAEQYEIAGALLGIGVVLWAVGRLVRARVATRRAG